MSLTNSSSTVKFGSLTAFTAAQNNFAAVEVHAYDLRDSSASSPITDTRLPGNSKVSACESRYSVFPCNPH